MTRYTLPLIWCTFILCVSLHAQELTVKSFKENTKDLAARTNQRVDNNGTPCALVKVQLVTSGAQFEGSVMGDVAYKTSEYWVYMPQGSKRLTVKTEGALPANVEFADYGVNSLTSNVTYVMAMQIKGGVASSGFSTTPKVFNINGVEFTMIPVEGGSFMMGATPEMGSNVEENEKPVHKVTLSNYYIGETEVTQELWEAVMGYNPSLHVGRHFPVEQVDFIQCKEFVRRLNIITGLKFSLPTEAQWEYAARGGRYSHGYTYSGSNSWEEVAWGRTNTTGQTQEVKTKKPNELGIYDMTGNVTEWCGDEGEPYKPNDVKDPVGFVDDATHWGRGGSIWDYDDIFLRISRRLPIGTVNNDALCWCYVGLRLSLSEDANPAKSSFTTDYKSLQRQNIRTFVCNREDWIPGGETNGYRNKDYPPISISPNHHYRMYVETSRSCSWDCWFGDNSNIFRNIGEENKGYSVIEFDSDNCTRMCFYILGYPGEDPPFLTRFTLEQIK